MALTKVIGSTLRDPYRKRGESLQATWLHQLRETANSRSSRFSNYMTSPKIEQGDRTVNRHNVAPNHLSGETILAIHSNH